jgi:iron complex outermembrane receptor protein
LAFDLSDDVILRMSASQVISRANYADLFSASSTDGFQNGTPNNETLNTGNIGLAPFKATQADLGIEWYYGDSSMVSATYFIKDISSFVTTELTPDQSIGIIDPDTAAENAINPNACNSGDCWVVSQKVAGSGGEIEGVELQWQHAFDNGFGFATNYTYVDGAAPKENYADMLGVFSDSSQHNANLVGYWENDTFSSRVAYNWRSEYMTREGNLYYGNRMNDAYGSLDLSLGWNITDSVTVSLEASNILEEDQIQTGEAPTNATDVKPDLRDGYPAWSYDGEARYKLGVAFSF